MTYSHFVYIFITSGCKALKVTNWLSQRFCMMIYVRPWRLTPIHDFIPKEAKISYSQKLGAEYTFRFGSSFAELHEDRGECGWEFWSSLWGCSYKRNGKQSNKAVGVTPMDQEQVSICDMSQLRMAHPPLNLSHCAMIFQLGIPQEILPFCQFIRHQDNVPKSLSSFILEYCVNTVVDGTCVSSTNKQNWP